MRRPVKAMAYYEYLSLRQPILLILLVLPALSLLLIDFFFTEALPSSFSYNNTEMVPLDFNKLEGNLFNYFPNDSATASVAESILRTIERARSEQLANRTIPEQRPLRIEGFGDFRSLQLMSYFDVLNQSKIPLELQLQRYNVSAAEYEKLKADFVPSLFSLFFDGNSISVGYNITYLEALNPQVNQSLTMLNYYRYYNNHLGPRLQALILEAISGQKYEIHSYPNYQVIYSEYQKIDRASFQAACVVLFTSITFFAARDRGRDHRILRMMSLNECVYWIVRCVSTLVYAFVSAGLLIFVAWFQKIAEFQTSTAETALISVAMLSLTGTGGAMLFSALFGSRSVVFPLIVSMLNGLIFNFMLEIIVYDVFAGSSIYDFTILPRIFVQILQFVEFSFSAFYSLDWVSIGQGAQYCVQQNDFQNLCQFSIPTQSYYLFVVLAQFAAYLLLALLVAVSKPEEDYPGCICLCRKVRPQEAMSIELLSHRYNARNDVLKSLRFQPEGHFNAGLVGLSGAGKTTLLKILSGGLKASKFKGTVYGYDLRSHSHIYKLRRVVGYCPQDNSNVFMGLSVEQNIKIAGYVKGQINDQRILGLEKQRSQPANSLSGGQLRRLALLNSIQGANKIQIFDEITSGLDPITCQAIDEYLKSLDISYILSTHDMKQVEELSNYVLILKKGQFLVNQPTQELVAYNDFRGVKIFVSQPQQADFIAALQLTFGESIKINYLTRRYVYAQIASQDDRLIQSMLRFLQLKQERGEIEAFTLQYNDFTDIICNYIEEDQIKFTDTVYYETQHKPSTFNALQRFFALHETKQTIIPFYVLLSACCLLFVMATYFLMDYVNYYINTQLERFRTTAYSSLASDCMQCCGISIPEGQSPADFNESEILLLLQQCPASCYASATTSYFSPSACVQFVGAIGGDIQSPRTYVANEGSQSFYSGQKYAIQNIYFLESSQRLYSSSAEAESKREPNSQPTLECALFAAKCAGACEQLANKESCLSQCEELSYGSVSADYAANEGFGACNGSAEEKTVFLSAAGSILYHYATIINNYRELNQSYCKIDEYNDEYVNLQIIQQFQHFNRSFIEFEGKTAHIYSYMPYYLGVSAFNDEFKANCSVTKYAAAKGVVASPLDSDFFQQVYQPIGQYYDTYSYYRQDLEWHRTGELYASIGNSERVGFFDGISYELMYLHNSLSSKKDHQLKDQTTVKGAAFDPGAELVMQAQAYPYFASVFPSNSYAMFTSQVYMVILTLPFCFAGVKLAVDLAHHRENHHFKLLNYHNVQESQFVLALACFRVFQIAPIIVIYAGLAYVAKLASLLGMLYLMLYELIIVISSCDVGLFVYKCKVGPSKAIFATSILLLALNFVAMFLFRANFFIFLFPYIQAIQRLQHLPDGVQHEWVFFVLALLSSVLYFLAMNRTYRASTSMPLAQMYHQTVDCHEVACGSLESAVAVYSLRVVLQDKEIVHEISFEIAENASVGLLGLSGSGKTTTLNALVGQQQYSGYISLNGASVVQDQCRVCFIPQFDILFERLTVKHHIDFFANLHGTKSSNLLRYLGLSSCARNRASQLSGGQRRRLSFAIACLSNYSVLACDEASTGLSPDLRRRMWALISARGGTQIITTHDMNEVESLCDYVVVMNDGRIVMRKQLAAGKVYFVNLNGKQCEIRGSDYARGTLIAKEHAQAQTRVLGRQFLQWIY